ncbi:MAG: arginine--tRNA ligase [Endomicrobiales bacterium]
MLKFTIRKKLDLLLSGWIQNHGIDALPLYSLEEPPKGIACDLASNIALLVAKSLKTPPRTIAQELATLIETQLSEYIKKVDVAGAGFLNILIADTILYNALAAGIACVKPTRSSSEKILIEFVSANPTGPLHIGHGRGAAIGDSLARIYEYMGYDIQREYYLNNIGNQMLMLGKSLEIRYRQLSGETIDFPEDGYKGDYIKDIARTLIDQKIPANSIDFKDTALKAMTATIEQDLISFDVRFDTWTEESSIIDQVPVICENLKTIGMAFEQEGALWFASSKYGDDKDRVLRRSDGRYTYLASDIAYHKNKIERGFSKLINLWGADHHGYVVRMKAAIQALGQDPGVLTIILYQLVSLSRNGVPVAMSTRAGEFETLEDVVKEVGRDACRFFFMLRAPDSALEFDLELAKKQSSENPVFYVQYVHARCCSIFREYELRSQKPFVFNPATIPLLATAAERNLLKKIAFFDDTLELCIKTNSPHHLTGYLMETADLYHKFYEQCRVLTDDHDLSSARLGLVHGIATTISIALNLLGVSAPKKM